MKVKMYLRNTMDGLIVDEIVIPGDENTPSGFTFHAAAGMFLSAGDVVRLSSMSTVELVSRDTAR